MTISHHSLAGLTSDEAKARLAHYGSNEVREAKPHALLTLLRKFWAPVPWMLEATIVLTWLSARYLDAAIIGFLLVFNIIISFLQEGQAEQTLALLRQRLAINARVLRDGQWQQVAARELVPGDVIHIRMGDVIPADTTIHDGALVVDQSPLTGESAPVEKGRGETLYSGAIARQGEATGTVTATGTKTYFGKTTELVKTARAVSHLETVILRIVTYLVVIDVLLVIAMLAFASVVHISLSGRAALRTDRAGRLRPCGAPGDLYAGAGAGRAGPGETRCARHAPLGHRGSCQHGRALYG